VLAVLVMVPLVYLVLTLGRVQAASFAAQGAAREAARAFVTSDDEASGRSRAESAAVVAAADQGFDPSTMGLEISCSSVDCLAPDARVTARTRVRVVLPGAPRFLPADLEVDATQVTAVDRFRGRTVTR
jgi:hypothetical protein